MQLTHRKQCAQCQCRMICLIPYASIFIFYQAETLITFRNFIMQLHVCANVIRAHVQSQFTMRKRFIQIEFEGESKHFLRLLFAPVWMHVQPRHFLPPYAICDDIKIVARSFCNGHARGMNKTRIRALCSQIKMTHTIIVTGSAVENRAVYSIIRIE